MPPATGFADETKHSQAQLARHRISPESKPRTLSGHGDSVQRNSYAFQACRMAQQHRRIETKNQRELMNQLNQLNRAILNT